MDLHIYRNSQDRWHDLRSAARERGAVLAVNAVTLDELVERLTPDLSAASAGTLCAFVSLWLNTKAQTRYALDAINELKAARVCSSELRKAGAAPLADLLDDYDGRLRDAGLSDPHDRCVMAASRVREGAAPWLQKFSRAVLHALYDLTEAQFSLVRSLIEALPDGGTVILFNTTANVKPTQFAEWTWQRFVYDESLAEKTFPDFCRSSNPSRAVLERLFIFENAAADRVPLDPDDSLRIIEAGGRYKEVERIGSDIADLLNSNASAHEIAVVVRHIELYGEMLEDVFSRYKIPHSFETGVPLVRIPFIKYWLALLDLATSERAREALGRVMSSAYYEPRLSPAIDVHRELAGMGYIDRLHLRASAHAARKNSPLTAELERLENALDDLERSTDTVPGFLSRLQKANPLTERDRQACRALLEELETVAIVTGKMTFVEFRRIASELAGIRTVDRLAGTSAAPGIPRIRILSPPSLGSREYKWIFAPGFADGEFPGRAPSNPLLPDDTIQAINSSIRPRRLMTSRDRNRREPLYLFMILDSAAKRVTLTYPGNTLEGARIYPSAYIAEIARHYANPPIERDAPLVCPRDKGEWLRAIADEWRRGSFSDDRARELLGEDVVARARLEAKGPARADVVRGTLALDGIWHPSELNALRSCPFVFLARHRLKLRPLQIPDFEVPALEVGILAHSILRDFYSRPVPASADEARARMDEIVTRQLAAADVNGQGPYSVFDPALWRIRRRQLVAVLQEYVNFAVRDALDGFETQSEYLDSPLPPASLGAALATGRPDHVAIHRTGGQIDAIRIDDFKYSAASSATTKQLKQSFQIPVYAYLAARALRAESGVRIQGRYLLLRSPGNPVVSQALDEMVFEEVRERIGGLLEKVRTGRLHPDPSDKQDCVACDYRRLCRLYGS
jgi:hypothetical protein